MTRRRSEAFGSKPVLLLLHGAGSSAAIFRIQTHFLAKALSPYFDLIYVDAPLRSGPGPGILPYFQGMEAYYRWFGTGIEKETTASRNGQGSDRFLSPEAAESPCRSSATQHKRRGSSSAKTRGTDRRGESPAAAISAAASLGLNLPRGAEGLSRGVVDLLDIANQSIPRQLEAQGVRSRDVVGVVGFSQGALAALGLLGVELAVGSPQWSNIRFCVAMGGATGGGAAQAAVAAMMSAANLLGGSKQPTLSDASAAASRGAGADSQLFPGHTVHVIGRCDPWVKDSRQIAGMCHPRRTKIVEFEGGHWVPREKHDISRVVDLILETELDSRRDADDSSSSSSEDEVEVLMRRLDALSVRN
ncbi:putative oxidoreductase [Diaporthe ampelina]|uniref:Putative oxidoreductase n=1 Tax=Diaporthe ampelina TaxID=1214573 RepID=A0A0G2F880_9PEZI|nr:putative oxidoreductase [Diaporthe ampelina]